MPNAERRMLNVAKLVLALGVWSLALTAGALAGQAKGQTPTFRARVDLVQVDVVVVDKDGVQVRGLTQRDFSVLDRGKAQAIAAFEEVAHRHEPAAAAAAPLPAVHLDVAMNQGARADRLVVMVIDDLHIWKDRTD